MKKPIAHCIIQMGDIMVSILLESAYSNSIWCKNLYEGLVDSLRQRRIPFCEIFDTCPAHSEGIFIIASDYQWVKSVISQFNKSGIEPILICNQLERIPECLYSCVCSDINASMRKLLNKLYIGGKKDIALYGVNTKSISDISRVESLFSLKDQYCNSMEVFTNEGSLSSCFDNFYSKINKFDTVICTNDFAAVSLVKKLKKKDSNILSSLTIISCTKTALSEGYSEITSIDLNFSKYGKEAVKIFERLQKHPYLSCITSGIVCDFGETVVRDNTDLSLSIPQSEDSFYDDTELKEMLIIDKFLSCCDSTDKEIVTYLSSGLSYEKTAEKCFLTESGIKYRIKKILQSCGAESKEYLINLLNEYC